ncbi:hypothetical protein [Brevibacillus dissolubilis]|uniref:hypothetical protein n=1 Tax=Brevibacillus dissolubilis TaxID=1844116 RepID=UPI001117343C|nr:hypothetical protein [Brevibacillus dissolubilis]
MNKEAVLDLIQRDVDGDLTADEEGILKEALRQDRELQLMHQRLMRVNQDLANLPDVKPPFSLVDSILPQLTEQVKQPPIAATEDTPSMPRLVRKETPSPEQPLKKRRKLPLWLAKAGSGVAAACLLIGLFVMSNSADVDRNSGTVGSNNPTSIQSNPEDNGVSPMKNLDETKTPETPSQQTETPDTPTAPKTNEQTKPESTPDSTPMNTQPSQQPVDQPPVFVAKPPTSGATAAPADTVQPTEPTKSSTPQPADTKNKDTKLAVPSKEGKGNGKSTADSDDEDDDKNEKKNKDKKNDKERGNGNGNKNNNNDD